MGTYINNPSINLKKSISSGEILLNEIIRNPRECSIDNPSEVLQIALLSEKTQKSND
jgi:hypothetical protein